MRQVRLLIAAMLLSAPVALHAQVVFPWPLNSPVSVPLNTTPIVTVDGRTIDFTPNLNQEFIDFLFISKSLGDPIFRFTVGLRARDGLASLSGVFPPSPDPFFVNQLPAFTPGSTDLYLFDLEIDGYGVPFSVGLTDMDGDSHLAQFATPIPEPATGMLFATGFVVLGGITMKRRNGRAI